MIQMGNGKGRVVRKCKLGCMKKVHAKGLCDMHYQRLRIYGNTNEIIIKKCTIENCNLKHHAKGLCDMHYIRLLRQGTTDDLPKRKFTKLCSVKGCLKKHERNNYCKLHARRMKSRGTTDKFIKVRPKCKEPNCNKPHQAKGYCGKHYQRYINPQSSSINHDLELEFAMKRVRQRDQNTCQWQNCDKTTKQTSISVHHIFPQSEYPELKYIEQYMICYCKEHHSYWHKMRGDKYYKFILSPRSKDIEVNKI